jgi:hypothetical protein
LKRELSSLLGYLQRVDNDYRSCEISREKPQEYSQILLQRELKTESRIWFSLLFFSGDISRVPKDLSKAQYSLQLTSREGNLLIILQDNFL